MRHRIRPPRARSQRALLSAALIATLVPLAGLASGCTECKSGESRCDGQQILSCGPAGDVTPSTGFTQLSATCMAPDQCKDLMVGTERHAVCTATGAPDPRCASVDGVVCADSTTRLVCDEGFGSFEQTCGACVIVDRAPPVCAVDADPPPACMGVEGIACDGNTLLRCHRSLAIERTPCSGDSPTCVENSIDPPRAYCAQTITCDGPDRTQCDGDTIRGCVAGHVVTMACPDGSECEPFTTSSRDTAAECIAR